MAARLAPTPPAATGAWAVEAQGVRKTYRLSRTNSYEALRGVDLRIGRGEFTAVIGPSGSGKSTLLNVLGTLDRPTAGTVRIDGVDTSTLSDNQLAELRNRRIGFVFQSYSLIARMTAVDNVALPMIPAGTPPPQRRARAEELLQRVGLGHRLANRPVELSGGEQQRVAIARALANEPGLLLTDEPTGALDTATSEGILGLLKELNATLGVTMVVVTHDPDLARETRRIVRIRDGRVEGDETLGAKP